MDWDFDDWGSWGVGDFYDSNKEELRKAIESGKPFDTGWHGFKKELESMRIRRTEDKTIVAVSEYMDEWSDQCDLICDALPDAECDKLTDEIIDEIRENLYMMMPDSNDETECEEELPVNATFDEIMAKANELMQICHDFLKEAFHICIGQTYYVLYHDHEHRNEDEVLEMIQKRIDEVG